jgi:hypothetical protein
MSEDIPSILAVEKESFLTYFDSDLKWMKVVHLWKLAKLILNR